MKNEHSPDKPRLDLKAVRHCAPGNFPWDQWERWALAQGLPAPVAAEGRLLIREASQHGWDPYVQAYCGWSDDGESLLGEALRDAKAARERWEILMRTEGFMGDRCPESDEWEMDYLQPDALKLRSVINPSSRRNRESRRVQ